MTAQRIFEITLLTLMCAATQSVLAGQDSDKRMIERGRYIVHISGCNDCHTPGYMEQGGNIKTELWLTGTSMGWQGPWGTTYPANLRLLVNNLTESQWMLLARQEMRPPMPWFALRAMSDADLRAVYRFLRSMGPKGEPAPAYVPPGQVVATPYLDMTPKNLPPAKQAAAQ
jgi:mono/diheme cytochrome c family protein